MKPETSPEAKVTELKLYYPGRTMGRQGSLERTTVLGKGEGSRDRGRPHMRWIELIKKLKSH